MQQLSELVGIPLLDAVDASKVVEVGGDDPRRTVVLARWCLGRQAQLHLVGHREDREVPDWARDVTVRHDGLALSVLPDLEPPDFVWIGGDHNWFTVFHELESLGESSRRSDAPFPLTVVEHVGWPYGRRDHYNDPDVIPGWFLHAYRRGGVRPEERHPVDVGFAPDGRHALHEGTPRNGVLTAVEDYVESREGDLDLRVLPGLHGVAVIADSVTRERLGDFWDELSSSQHYRRVLEATERDRVSQLVTMAAIRLERDHAQEAHAHALRQLDDERREVESLTERIESLRAQISSAEEAAQAERLKHRRQLQEARTRFEQRLRDQRAKARDRNRSLRKELQRRDARIERLRKRLKRSRRKFRRLRRRRSVRAVLRIARLARPLFRIRRRLGATKQRDQQTQQPKSRERRRRDQDRRQLPDRSNRGGGTFDRHLGALMSGGLPELFVSDFERSERSLPRPELAGDQPLVSVVMPTYNRAGLIGEAISAVLEQTYTNWELLVCDDGSTDSTADVVRAFGDSRIRYLASEWKGAAAARNRGLSASAGSVIAYLDTDNVWHPRFLEVMVGCLMRGRGRHMAYCKYVDVVVASDGSSTLKKAPALPFDFDDLAEKNFIDLNTVVHRRSLYEHLGGFDEDLLRRQDWDLLLRYTFSHVPTYVDQFLVLYRRSESWDQISAVHKDEGETGRILRSRVDSYYQNGVPSTYSGDLPSVSVISWDVSRNHFSKAYNVAEALTGSTSLQLLGFRFFDEPIFPPYRSAEPTFSTAYFEGGAFPEWSDRFAKACVALEGDVLYAVKPRLPSLGLALLANYHTGRPIILEINDLESVVTKPGNDPGVKSTKLEDVDPSDPRLLEPYGELWTVIMEGLAHDIPVRATHNTVLDEHFGGGAYFIRNLKDDVAYDPALYDRSAVREELGFGHGDRILLFGGMVRKHKGVFEIARAIADTPNWKLLVVGSRETPDQRRLESELGDRVLIMPPVDRNVMAAINYASDAVVLWLDPAVPASRYQMPFKLTDALAMEVPVVASEVGDLEVLGDRGYLRTVPFGDSEALHRTLTTLDVESEETRRMVERGRRLYLREFSYFGGRRTLEFAITDAAAEPGVLPVAERFAEFFGDFWSHCRDQPGVPSDAIT